MGEMIERVAKAIDPHAFSDWQRSFDYEMGKSGDAIEAKDFADWCGGRRKSEALEKAHAAILAMKEPTDEMAAQVAAKAEHVPSEAHRRVLADGWKRVYRDMIDAALSRPTSKEVGNG